VLLIDHRYNSLCLAKKKSVIWRKCAESTELMITTPGFNKGADRILISENLAKHTSQRQNETKLGPIHLYQMLASKNPFYILVISAKFLTWLYVLAGSPGNPPTPGSCPYDSSHLASLY
jgi:hypothetical protein